MASAGLNFQNLTPSNGALTELGQLIFLALSDVEGLGNLFNFMPNQKHGDKLGFVGEFGLLGKAATGCSPEYANDLINTSEKEWDIKEWEIAEKICYKDLVATLAKSALRSKTKIDDLTGTAYMDDVLSPLLERAVKKLVLRFAFFGDKNASTYSSSNTSGTLVEGTDAGNFTLIDGFFKRIFTAVAAGTITNVSIAANAQTTWAAQKAAMLASGVATGIMDELIMSAPAVLRQQDNKRIYVTQALADALSIDIRQNNKGSELQWQSLFDGVSMTKYSGIDVIAVPFLDEIIQSYLKNSTNPNAYDKPYRAILTIKDNLMVGSESESEVADIEAFFDQKSRYNHVLAKDTIGTLIAQEDLMVVAY